MIYNLVCRGSIYSIFGYSWLSGYFFFSSETTGMYGAFWVHQGHTIFDYIKLVHKLGNYTLAGDYKIRMARSIERLERLLCAQSLPKLLCIASTPQVWQGSVTSVIEILTRESRSSPWRMHGCARNKLCFAILLQPRVTTSQSDQVCYIEGMFLSPSHQLPRLG